MIRGILALAGTAQISPLIAQELPLLDSALVRAISAEVSGDASYEHVRFMTQFHRFRGGSDGLMRVAEYVAAKAEEYGLEDVRIIKQPYGIRPWNARFAELRLVEPWAERIASTLQTPLHLGDYSRAADVSAELVDIGAGTAADYARVDVRGKVVLTYGNANIVMREAVGERGAAGLVVYPNPFNPPTGIAAGIDRPDQLRWTILAPGAPGGHEPSFAFVLSIRQGLELREKLAAATSPLIVRAVVDAGFHSTEGSEPWQVMVEAFIRGTEPGLGQDVVLTAHIQEEKTSANDDASGSANLLELGRALKRLIDAGALPRPRRSLRLWWTTENSSERQYFRDHPEEVARIWVNVNQDMVGADQSQDVMRKQNITRLPATRFHFLNDVAEAVIEYMVAGNTIELATFQNGTPGYPRPHVAHLGSRHRYAAEMIFFHTNSDHISFLETPTAIPGISFTNFPDRFIHSSDDDLWNLDRTQLGRNALGAALIGYIMAASDAANVAALAAESVGRGQERMSRNLRLGQSWLARADDRAAAWWDAVDQIGYAAAREWRAIGSLTQAHASARAAVEAHLAELNRREQQALRELESSYRRLVGGAPPRERQLSAAEHELARLTPTVAGTRAELTDRRGEIYAAEPPGLHSLMAFEALNTIDGERTGLDIYRLVAAQAREAGAHYYGTVTADDLLAYLRSLGLTGLVVP